MRKPLSVALLLLLLHVNNSFAADISGQVTSAEGEPVCALVLASGNSVFSCDPIGQFSLSGLPLEPDGSVRLQVYAEGFFPYIRKITLFGPQPAVVMPRAGSCPVGDGLSNTSPLDGTYRLIRSTVYFNDGDSIDTADSQGGVQATGTMEITGNNLAQRLDMTLNGVAQTPVVINTTFEDFGFGILPTGGNPVMFIERGNKVTTFVNGNASGLPLAEVDHWAKVTSTVLSLESGISLQTYMSPTIPVGTLVGTMTEGRGFKLVLKKIPAK